jgi:hypothetical protein
MRIKKVIDADIALGVEVYAKEFNCKLHAVKGLSEKHIEIDVEGSEEDLRLLNEKAKNYKPSSIKDTGAIRYYQNH